MRTLRTASDSHRRHRAYTRMVQFRFSSLSVGRCPFQLGVDSNFILTLAPLSLAWSLCFRQTAKGGRRSISSSCSSFNNNFLPYPATLNMFSNSAWRRELSVSLHSRSCGLSFYIYCLPAGFAWGIISKNKSTIMNCVQVPVFPAVWEDLRLNCRGFRFLSIYCLTRFFVLPLRRRTRLVLFRWLKLGSERTLKKHWDPQSSSNQPNSTARLCILFIGSRGIYPGLCMLRGAYTAGFSGTIDAAPASQSFLYSEKFLWNSYSAILSDWRDNA